MHRAYKTMESRGPHIGDAYIAWLYRLYGRQQSSDPSVEIQVFEKASGPLLPPIIYNRMDPAGSLDSFWNAYSESGAIVGRVSRLAYQYGNQKKKSKKKDLLFMTKELCDELENLVTARYTALKAAVSNTPYISTVIDIDASLVKGMILFDMRGDKTTGLSLLKIAADLEFGNEKTTDSPTLPIVSALDTYIGYMSKAGQHEKDIGLYLNMTYAKWKRTSPLIPFN
jgi:hypothetical protein